MAATVSIAPLELHPLTPTGEPNHSRRPKHRPQAAMEARSLFVLMNKLDCGPDAIRELIRIEPSVKRRLDEFMEYSPEDAPEVAHALRFRERVSGEFERLLRSQTIERAK